MVRRKQLSGDEELPGFTEEKVSETDPEVDLIGEDSELGGW